MKTEMILSRNLIRISVDGACQPNPGVGGYAVIIESSEGMKYLKQGYRLTTNNRMELLAIIKAIEYCIQQGWHDKSILIFSDSKYAVYSFNNWAEAWKNNNWKKLKTRHQIENKDLIAYFLNIAKPFIKRNKLILEHLYGHSSNELNDQADALAKSAIKEGKLMVDQNYENKSFEQYNF